MSHPYIIHAAIGDPPRSSHQKILEEEKTQLGHAHDVLPRFLRIVEIAQADIDKCTDVPETT